MAVCAHAEKLGFSTLVRRHVTLGDTAQVFVMQGLVCACVFVLPDSNTVAVSVTVTLSLFLAADD